ncbi:MAG: DUF922 domain-containing protein [Syntrophales bacterium]
MNRILFLLVFITQVTVADAATMYKCIDGNGTILITDTPLPNAKCEFRSEGNQSAAGSGQSADMSSNQHPAVDSTVPQAEVIDDLDYTYYPAEADSARSLQSILTAASPIRHNGRVFHGYYHSDMSWELQWFRQPEGRCKIIKLTIRIIGEITLPRLVGGTDAQREQFDTLLPALRVHELGHHDIDKEAAAAIGRKILSLPEMSSCAALESAANDLGDQTINEYRERNEQYDAETNHGRLQGVRLES